MEKRLDEKAKLISNFTQPAQKILALHILSNISRSKSNQTMKFGQLIEYDIINIFLDKSNTNMMEMLVPCSFMKYKN